MRAMCTNGNDNPKTASRPFDAERSGFVMGEGAGVLLLEEEEHALKRGAKIYCELAGYSANCDAFHITAPHPEGEGMANCLINAMASAGVEPTDVDYINAHGTSTPLNDKFETMAYKRVFGEHAPSLKVSSTKGAIGHLLGCARAACPSHSTARQALRLLCGVGGSRCRTHARGFGFCFVCRAAGGWWLERALEPLRAHASRLTRRLAHLATRGC